MELSKHFDFLVRTSVMNQKKDTTAIMTPVPKLYTYNKFINLQNSKIKSVLKMGRKFSRW